jgi:hypothetical protein
LWNCGCKRREEGDSSTVPKTIPKACTSMSLSKLHLSFFVFFFFFLLQRLLSYFQHREYLSSVRRTKFKLGSQIRPKLEFKFLISFLFICALIFVGVAKVFLVSGVTWLCMKNLSSNLGLILDLNLSLGFFLFFLFCCKHCQSIIGAKSSLLVQEEPNHKFMIIFLLQTLLSYSQS